MARKSRKHLNNAPLNTAPPIRTYNAGAYLRISVEDANSISNQKFLIEARAELECDIKLHKFYIDDGASSFADARPAFDALIKDLSEGIIDCVITKDLSRFGRDYIETGDYIFQIFPACGIRVISILDKYDSLKDADGPGTGVILSTILNSSYSFDVSRKIKSVIQTKQMKGTYIPAQLPYGYKKKLVSGKTQFVIDDYAAEVVRKIFDWSLDGESNYTIAGRLNDLDIFSPKAYRSNQRGVSLVTPPIWTSQGVSGILKNRTYIGCLVMGKTRTPDGHLNKPEKVPQNEWLFSGNHHEPIISAEHFEQVQERLASQKQQATHLSVSKQSYVGGKLYCGSCGRKMKRRFWSGKTYYMCPRNLESKGGCPTRSISEEKLKKAIFENIQIAIEKAREYRAKQLQFEQSLAYKIKREHEKSLLSNLRQQRNVLTTRKSKLYEKVITETAYAFQDYFLYKNYADDEIQKIDKKIGAIEDSQRRHQDNHSSEALWIGQLLRFEKEFQLTKEMLESLIKTIHVNSRGIAVRFMYNRINVGGYLP